MVDGREEMNIGLAVASLLCACTGLALILYLWYLILIHIHSTDIMWFVFTLYIPFAILGTVLSKVIDWSAKHGTDKS